MREILPAKIERLLTQLESNEQAKRFAFVDGLWFITRLLAHPSLQSSLQASWLDRLSGLATKVLPVLDQQVQDEGMSAKWRNHMNKLGERIIALNHIEVRPRSW